MILERFVCGRPRANAYLYAPVDGGSCLIVDPGPGAGSRIVAKVREHGLTPRAVLLTHGHPDHIWTAREVSDRYGIPTYLHPSDWRWLDDPATGGYIPLISFAGRLVGRIASKRPSRLHQVEGNQVLDLGGIGVRALHTPGHTAGGTCFVTEGVCFVGDTIFRGGLGHTMYPGGDRSALRRSVRVELLPLDDDVRLLPGHGDGTTMGDERALLQRFTRSS